ncbi:MAG: S41 family peptidase [candidate division WOR-3 bacterium]|nr:MAG: S41 family peptidase [candidate division WOR-3 bacterium]
MKKASILLCLIFLVCGGMFIGQKLWATPDTYSMLRAFNKILKELQDSYVTPVSADSLIRGAIDGMIDMVHDPHTDFLTREEYSALRESTTGEFGGIGATIGRRDERIMVISPLEGTPAYRSGLQPGDEILNVDGAPTEGKSVDVVVKEIRGDPGTEVILTIHRSLIDEPFDVEITRAIIKLDAVPYFGMIDDKIGYVYLRNFSISADVELKEALDSLFAMGAEKLVFDLRLNSGGLLNEGLTVSELFLSRGKEIVATKGRNERERMFRSQKTYSYVDFPMITLVDGGSASASEIVAGALQDWDRSLIVGTTTFGKGSVQNIIPFEDSTALKLTTARWYTPSGRSIDKPVDWDGLDGRVTSAQQRLVDRLRSELEELREQAETDAEIGIVEKIEDDLYDIEDNIYRLRVDSTKLAEQKEFTTLGPLKRKVYGEGGITPDIVIEPQRLSRLETEILTKGLTFDFVVKYTAEHNDITDNFEVEDKLLKEFAVYLLEHEIEFTQKEYADVKDRLRSRLKQEFYANLWGMKEGYRIRVADDSLVQQAVKMLKEVSSSQDLFRYAGE